MTRCVISHLIPWSNFLTNFHWSQLSTSFTTSLKTTYQRANSYIMEAAVSSWQFHRYSCPGSSDLQEEHILHFSQVCILFHCCNLKGLLPVKQILCPMQNAGIPGQILLGWMRKLPILYGGGHTNLPSWHRWGISFMFSTHESSENRFLNHSTCISIAGKNKPALIVYFT